MACAVPTAAALLFTVFLRLVVGCEPGFYPLIQSSESGETCRPCAEISAQHFSSGHSPTCALCLGRLREPGVCEGKVLLGTPRAHAALREGDSCGPGRFWDGDFCNFCPVGTFSDGADARACAPCLGSQGQYAPQIGSTACQSCGRDSYVSATEECGGAQCGVRCDLCAADERCDGTSAPPVWFYRLTFDISTVSGVITLSVSAFIAAVVLAGGVLASIVTYRVLSTHQPVGCVISGLFKRAQSPIELAALGPDVAGELARLGLHHVQSESTSAEWSDETALAGL